jgi:hypothetical protein
VGHRQKGYHPFLLQEHESQACLQRGFPVKATQGVCCKIRYLVFKVLRGVACSSTLLFSVSGNKKQEPERTFAV